MQTAFTPEQLADPKIAHCEAILRKCVHCGFCTATCPTYVLLGDERDSPRGRIYMIKEMLENDRPASEDVARHIDRCLSCLACVTTCPSGVDYMHLVDHARAHIEATYRRPFADRAIRGVLAAILPDRRRFRLALVAALFARITLPLLRRLPGMQRLAAMLALAPTRLPPRSPYETAQVVAPAAPRRGRVAILTGCAQPVLAPEINEAAIRLLTRAGYEVVIARGEGCCGALVHHMGREAEALAAARRNIDAWTAEIEAGGLDAIVITASGCGTTVKDYGHMLRHDPAYAEKAARVAALARDVTEVLAAAGLGEPQRPGGLVVAYHSACSMQHGQRLGAEPRALLAGAGFELREVPEGHLCCGSAGTYNMLQPEIAARLRERKLGNIARTGAEVVATGNIGCITQLRSGTRMPIVHTVELLDWAYGGPEPAALSEPRLAAE